MSFTNPRHLKLTQAYSTYTGQFGRYMFEDGLSVEPIPMNERDRIACAIPSLEVCEDGTEIEAGPVARMVSLRNTSFPDEKLTRMTEEDKEKEDINVVLASFKLKPLLKREDLEKIADKEGISGVRKVAAVWDVKSKSIVDLMAMIIDAQDAYVLDKTEELKAKGASDERINFIFNLVGSAPETKTEASSDVSETKTEAEPEDAVKSAAQAGDLGAALAGE
jgi:hypothetical protein